ncbi:unnamed protein product, partial [marine sediment metagenome]
ANGLEVPHVADETEDFYQGGLSSRINEVLYSP